MKTTAMKSDKDLIKQVTKELKSFNSIIEALDEGLHQVSE